MGDEAGHKLGGIVGYIEAGNRGKVGDQAGNKVCDKLAA